MHLALVFSMLLLAASTKHLFYAIEKNARYVPESKSLPQLLKCKQLCLQMRNHYAGLRFRFHRMILRQPNTDTKYFVGECEWKRSQDNVYKPWSKLPYNDSRWREYDLKCGNQHLALSSDLIKALNFSRSHSNFLYYDDGKFINKQPFEDLPQLMASVTNLQRKVFGGKAST